MSTKGTRVAGTCEWITQNGLVPQSARDYLLRKEPDSNAILEEFRIKPEEAHLELAWTCFDCVACSGIQYAPLNFDNGSFSQESSLLKYAALHWPEHARYCSTLVLELFDLSGPSSEGILVYGIIGGKPTIEPNSGQDHLLYRYYIWLAISGSFHGFDRYLVSRLGCLGSTSSWTRRTEMAGRREVTQLPEGTRRWCGCWSNSST